MMRRKRGEPSPCCSEWSEGKRREEKVETSVIVIFETVYTLQRFYRIPRPRVRALLLPVLRLRGLHLPHKVLCVQALDLYRPSLDRPSFRFYITAQRAGYRTRFSPLFHSDVRLTKERF